jgi:inosine-uridine nucleoside N-ribohydrolase
MGELGERSDAYYARYAGYQDLNINVDPNAAAYVLQYGGDFPIYPNEFMDDAWFTRDHLRQIENAHTPLSDFTARELKPFFHLMRLYNSLHGHPGLYLHGVIPLAVALDPSLAEPPRRLRVKMTELRFGGHAFTITDDPAVPMRDVYVKLRDQKTVEERAVAACQ